MRLLIQAAAAAVLVAAPALAQDAPLDPATMTCADFTAMDSEGQMQAMVALQSGMTGQVMGDMTDEAAEEGMMTEDAAAAEGTGDAAAADTATTDTAAADAGTTDTATADAAAGDTAASGGGAAGEDPMMAAVMTACEGSPDMMASEAMMQAQGG